VRVNGTVVREPGTKVEPDRDRVEVHGRLIPGRSALRYLMLHKPVGVITTLDDPEGRPTIRAMLPPGPRMFPVGRLDAETSGLLIATNDGDLAHHLMHPRYGVAKVYRVRLDRPPDADQMRRLRTGVEFEPGVTSSPCEVRVKSERADRAEIEMTIHEGRYRQVRRMCEAVGLAVKGLHRAAYGPLRLGALERGSWRDLTAEEVRRLRAASARPTSRLSRAPGRAPARATPGAERTPARRGIGPASGRRAGWARPVRGPEPGPRPGRRAAEKPDAGAVRGRSRPASGPPGRARVPAGGRRLGQTRSPVASAHPTRGGRPSPGSTGGKRWTRIGRRGRPGRRGPNY
jgi:pseudouridine synthase